MQHVLIVSTKYNSMWTVRARGIEEAFHILLDFTGIDLDRKDFTMIHLYGTFDFVRISLEQLHKTHIEFETYPETVMLKNRELPLILMRDSKNHCIYFVSAPNVPKAQAVVQKYRADFAYENFSLIVSTMPVWEFNLETLSNPFAFPTYQALAGSKITFRTA